MKMLFSFYLLLGFKLAVNLALIRDAYNAHGLNRELSAPFNIFATQQHPMVLNLEPPHQTHQSSYSVPANEYLTPEPPTHEYLTPKNEYLAPPTNEYLTPQREYLTPRPTVIHIPVTRRPQHVYTAPKYTTAIFRPRLRTYRPTHDKHDHEEHHLTKKVPRSYKFRYNVNNEDTGTYYGHSEVRQSNVVHGEYSVLLPDGRLQTVKYYADETGYHPTITYS